MRWDFGFTCLFCLRHEVDIIPSGSEGWGVTSAEHLELQSEMPGAADDYENVVSACKRCNRDRGNVPRVGDSGARLLDPTSTAWASRFRLDGDGIRPVDGDADAEYTSSTYQMNAQKKRDARRIRAKKIRTAVRRIDQARQQEAKLLQIARNLDDSTEQRELRTTAREVRRSRLKIVKELASTYSAIPVDAPHSCRCDPVPELVLPAWLARQCGPAPEA